MTKQTKYFVLGSVSTIAVGLAVGVLAFYGGIPGIASSQSGSLSRDLEYVAADASVVAFANVKEVMRSQVRQHVRKMEPQGDEKKDFESKTGINIESDIDRVLAFVVPEASGLSSPDSGGCVLARGLFDQVKIEGLVRQHGARTEDYSGVKLFVHDEPPLKKKNDSFALAFIEPGLVAVGSTAGVRRAIDSKKNGKNITGKPDLMKQIDAVDEGNLWAVGRFDVLMQQPNFHFPAEMTGKLPPISTFSASGRVNGGVSATLTAQTSDEQGANNLRDIVRGMLALARMQTSSNPQVQTLLQSLQMGGSGTTVSISFTLPVELIDALSAPKKKRAE